MDAPLTNREIAVGAWLIAGFLWAMTYSSIRTSLWRVVEVAAGPKIAIPLLLFAAYVVAVVAIASQVGIWETSLVKDTVFWFAVAGLAMFGRFGKINDDRFVRRTLIAAVAVPELFQFLFGTVSFHLGVELLLFPLLLFTVMTGVFAGTKDEYRDAKRFLDGLAAVIGVALIVGTVYVLVTTWSSLDGRHLVLSFYLPIWLTATAIPAVVVIGTYAKYEAAFVRVWFAAQDDPKARRRARLALLLGFHMRVHAMEEFVRWRLQDLVHTKSLGEALRLVRTTKREARSPSGNLAQDSSGP
jgi:hypothetical protein